MALSEYGNAPTHVSKKKIFALVAVALMICSVFAIFVATEQKVAADSEVNEYTGNAIVIEYNGGSWAKQGADPLPSGVTLVGNTLTLKNFISSVQMPHKMEPSTLMEKILLH